MNGLHLTADLYHCKPQHALLTDLDLLKNLCERAVHDAGLLAVNSLFHHFTPTATSGITGVVLLAESHLAIHTWPEQSSVTLDVYVCNFGADNSHKAEALLDTLVTAFEPTQTQRNRLVRGF